MDIIRNAAQCLICNDIIESKTAHDYVKCTCGAIAVDGGLEHVSRTGERKNWKELSEYATREE